MQLVITDAPNILDVYDFTKNKVKLKLIILFKKHRTMFPNIYFQICIVFAQNNKILGHLQW